MRDRQISRQKRNQIDKESDSINLICILLEIFERFLILTDATYHIAHLHTCRYPSGVVETRLAALSQYRKLVKSRF